MYVITPSLYNAYYWYKHLDNASDEDFLNVLKKSETPKSELMQRGIDFENSILTAAETGEYIGDDAIRNIAEIVQGGEWQRTVRKVLDSDFLLYGRVDVYFPKKIYDIKFTDSYELGKYKYSIQHTLYMYCADVPEFEYLIGTPSSFYREHYWWDEEGMIQLRSRVHELIDFILYFPHFKEEYEKHWIAK